MEPEDDTLHVPVAMTPAEKRQREEHEERMGDAYAVVNSRKFDD